MDFSSTGEVSLHAKLCTNYPLTYGAANKRQDETSLFDLESFPCESEIKSERKLGSCVVWI